MNAEDALARPEVARQLEELDAALHVPGNVQLCQRLLRTTHRWYDQHPPNLT